MNETTITEEGKETRENVRRGYAEVARGSGGCCGSSSKAKARSQALGYSAEELEAVPTDANLGVGCGNPTGLAEIQKGETVLDLGSGAGIDCFLAAKEVGPDGLVIGVDMTDDMLEKARKNARDSGFDNVEFRKGFIEDLPVDDGVVDLVISNCVINLSPSKSSVFGEVSRVLRPGGRLVISDIVLDRELPPAVLSSVEAYVGCVAGAMKKDDYLETIRSAGFEDVEILSENHYGTVFTADSPDAKAFAEEMRVDPSTVSDWASAVVSVKVRAVKK